MIQVYHIKYATIVKFMSMKEHPEVAAKNFFDQGVRLLEAQEFAAAIAPLDAALKLDPTYSDAWCCRALVLGHLKRYAESVESFDRALTLSPKRSSCFT